MASAMGRMYGAATMVGKDEMNGRVNPAMEPDDDLPIAEVQRIRAAGGGGQTGQDVPVPGTGQANTAF